MARNDESGEAPQTANGEWQEIENALRLAVEMAMMTADGLDSVVSQQIRTYPRTEPDPRVSSHSSPYQSRILSLLQVHFRLQPPDPQEVANLRDAYRRIHQRLTGLSRISFRLVSDGVARRVSGEGRGDTFGYVVGRTLPIFLNETYFGQTRQNARDSSPRSSPTTRVHGVAGSQLPGSPRGQRAPGPVRGHVEVEQGGVRITYSREIRAGVILHETVHVCYGAEGAVHRAIRSGESVASDVEDCSVGYRQITSYTAALNDAYVFERFARCVHQAASSQASSRP